MSEILDDCELTEDVEGYLLGRGARPEIIEVGGFKTFRRQDEIIPDESFRSRYGRHGERLDGYLVCPFSSLKGELIGFEARDIKVKRITEFRLPEASWNPVWLGLWSMEKIWAGGNIWIGEGLFDVLPLEWAVPESDAVLGSLRAKLTFAHVQFLKRFCKGWVHMVYDRDDTGRRGTVGYVDETGKRKWGAIDSLENAGLRCNDVYYGNAKDPGEIWDRGGVEGIRAAFPLR